MPPKRKAPPLPPVPGVEEMPPELCLACFPAGLAGTPEGATVVSCGHGAWRTADLVITDETYAVGGVGDGQSPADPDGEQTPEDPGDGKGDGAA
ncbi:hypothetical protein [Streptosporangium sp. NPDC006007]|uniref:hypothetical protein n=1 Tax=Streptosporangium sp. NPDC006007 TaxID=3154575 RepID=UPI0033A8220E